MRQHQRHPESRQVDARTRRRARLGHGSTAPATTTSAEPRRAGSARLPGAPLSPASRGRASRQLGAGHPLPRAGTRSLYRGDRRTRSPRSHRRARRHRQGHRHRPRPDRPHAAIEPGDLHRWPSHRSASCSRAAREQGARVRTRAILVQRRRGPLRGVRGCRRAQDRDALSCPTSRSLPCEECDSRQRYNAETLEILFHGPERRRGPRPDRRARRLELFGSVPAIARRLQGADGRGARLPALGQSATTLSGGEAQRVKLAKELSKRPATGSTIYILDEPTTGLALRGRETGCSRGSGRSRRAAATR